MTGASQEMSIANSKQPLPCPLHQSIFGHLPFPETFPEKSSHLLWTPGGAAAEQKQED